jgi:hypothetical protein
LQVYLDETREAHGGLLRPGNAGSNTADDHVAVLDGALRHYQAPHHQALDRPTQAHRGARSLRVEAAFVGRAVETPALREQQRHESDGTS